MNICRGGENRKDPGSEIFSREDWRWKARSGNNTEAPGREGVGA